MLALQSLQLSTACERTGCLQIYLRYTSRCTLEYSTRESVLERNLPTRRSRFWSPEEGFPKRSEEMQFTRVWDSTCPRVWDTWESNGIKWVIQDLPPEDDEKAIEILIEHFCPDEVSCAAVGLVNDPASIRGGSKYWRNNMKQRMSLACYAEVGGQRELAALNVCIVKCLGDAKVDAETQEGEAWRHVYRTLEYGEMKIDIFKYMESDRVLVGAGLCVVRKYRGAKLGARVLAAREPLCRSQGIVGTETLFTGAASQICAAKVGFTTLAVIPLKEMAEAGFMYRKDDDRVMKLMFKKYE